MAVYENGVGVAGGINSVASGGITATSIAANAIGASEIAADAVAEIADGIWDETSTGHKTVDTFGYQSNRVHVGPHNFTQGATDYWFVANADINVAAGATNPSGLDGWGWVMNSIAFSETQTGDFLSAADVTQTGMSLDASGDSISYPNIFGGYAHMLIARSILGYTPTKLCMEVYGAFTVASANEPATFFGFLDNGGADPVGAGSAACIYSNGTNFICASDNGTDTGAAIDTLPHLWKIQIDATNTEWFIDGVSQGTFTTEQDIWPVSPKLITSTTNRIIFSFFHIWYE